MQLGVPNGVLSIFRPILSLDTNMTAIGVVGLPDGFVIAADGRATLADESRATATDQERARESYSFTKIFHIHERDKNLAYAMAGTIKMGAMEVLEEIDKQ